MKNYAAFKLEDFILDESFRTYVTKHDPQVTSQWDKWLTEHPEKRDDVNYAIKIMDILLKARKKPVMIDKNEALQSLMQKLNDSENKNSGLRKIYMSPWFAIAATILVLFVLNGLWQTIGKSTVEKDLSTFQIIVPIGEKSQIILADGTHVWINSGSKFTYSALYGKTNRDVTLDGEAYFDVSHNKKLPFNVHSGDVNVKVYGTAFNVKNYTSDKTVETTVVRGLVKVESLMGNKSAVFVSPNEKAVFLKEKRALTSQKMKLPEATSTESDEQNHSSLIVENINPEPLTCWKDQLLVFSDETLDDMVVKMERWYNVQITIEDHRLSQERFNGKFVHNETVYQVLEAIKLTTPIDYSVIDNNIFIKRKSKN